MFMFLDFIIIIFIFFDRPIHPYAGYARAQAREAADGITWQRTYEASAPYA